MKYVPNLDCYIVSNDNNLYGIVNKDRNNLVPNSYLYIDYAFDKYFVAYKNEEGLGVITKDNEVIVKFGYDILTKIGDKNLLRAVKMGSREDVTTILSKDMKEIITLPNANIDVQNNYIVVYNGEKIVYIDNDGIIREEGEINIILPEKLKDFYKTYKENGEIYYSDQSINEEM